MAEANLKSSPSRIKILHLEDNASDAALISHIIKSSGLTPEIHLVNNREAFEKALTTAQFDLVLCDYSLPSYDGLEALQECRRQDDKLPFIFISGTIGEERAVESIKQGATDYILKSHPDRLMVAIRRALAEAAQRKEHQRMEEALRRSEKRLRHIAENAKDVIYSYLFTPEPRFDYISPAVQQVTGDPPEAFYADATLVLERVVPEDLPVVRDVFEHRKIPSGPTLLRWINKDGKIIWTEHTLSGIYEKDQLIGFEGIGRDITEAKEKELQIREQAELLERATDSIFVVGLKGKFAYWNHSARTRLGFGEQDLPELSLDKIWAEQSRTVAEHLKEVRSRKEWSGELQFKTKSGQPLLFDSRWSFIDKANAPDSILVINSDITEKKNLEKQLFRAQRLESIGALAGGIAHDLNNVLAPILMASSMMRDEQDTATLVKWAETIESSAKRGAELIKQILAFTRGTEGATASVDLGRVVKDIQKVLRATLPPTIKLATKIPARLWTIRGNFTELHQIIMNLCINARDAMPEGGTITVRAENLSENRQKKRVRLEVEDTGSGIPPELVNRIFDPFFTTKPAGQGTGLGLATVQAIVQKYHGNISLDSQVGKGTVFRLTFPASEAPDQDSSEKRPDLLPGRGERLLLVEDEAALREMLKVTLSGLGYKVSAAANGVEAIALVSASTEIFDLVITDVSMPVMGGLALAEELTRRNPAQRLLVMSGMLERQVFDQISAKNKFLLPKPFSTASLLKEIRQALERA